MNHCEACKHWDCEAYKVPTGYGACSAIIGMDHYDRDELKEWPKALAVACELAGVDVLTRADFGCVLHEARSEES